MIFNDEMDDFAIPTRDDPTYLLPTVPNYVEPGKRPQSSTTPTILLDGDRVKMVVGASGGAKITTAAAQASHSTHHVQFGRRQLIHALVQIKGNLAE